MEEQILKIMKLYGARLQTQQFNECAKEISSMVMEYFEWLNFESDYIPKDDAYWDIGRDKMATITEIFEQWNNIRKP